uniref:Uncharacterized protein n=1 Tax=Romanomermis culicivorax TaxID=13658 RepID=A0A915IV43_ROMCU
MVGTEIASAEMVSAETTQCRSGWRPKGGAEMTALKRAFPYFAWP